VASSSDRQKYVDAGAEKRESRKTVHGGLRAVGFGDWESVICQRAIRRRLSPGDGTTKRKRLAPWLLMRISG
jgi:hypothetical protein